MIKQTALLVVLLLTPLVGTGCVEVLQYQRQYLSDPMMRMDTPLKDQLEEHIFPRREGSRGGESGAGGGCGC
jgi:hypothetical protein